MSLRSAIAAVLMVAGIGWSVASSVSPIAAQPRPLDPPSDNSPASKPTAEPAPNPLRVVWLLPEHPTLPPAVMREWLIGLTTREGRNTRLWVKADLIADSRWLKVEIHPTPFAKDRPVTLAELQAFTASVFKHWRDDLASFMTAATQQDQDRQRTVLTTRLAVARSEREVAEKMLGPLATADPDWKPASNDLSARLRAEILAARLTEERLTAQLALATKTVAPPALPQVVTGVDHGTDVMEWLK